MTETTVCVVCGGEIEIPLVRPRSDTWSHTDQGKCVAVLRAQRETMNSEVAAWAKRAQQAESDLAALRARIRALLTKPATVEGLDPEATRLVEGALRQVQDYLRALSGKREDGGEGTTP